MHPAVIHTDRLVLDLPVSADAALVADYCQDPLFERFMTLPWPYQPHHAEFFVDTFVPKGWERDNEYTWALRERIGGPFLGVIGWRRALGDIGFWLGAPHRGRGLMTEALHAVCDFVMTELEQSEVAWECVVGNAASVSVARKAGFSYTGERPANVPGRDGSRPASWHGILRAGDSREPKVGWPG